ncbi:MAG: DNA-binding protein [Dehalobacter sp. 4CP]|uniref:metallophosphoesterase family protein n=1 Tax=Dehalobacter sp. CP TaxID=2594474 RepID=UPI0013C9C01F|nr:DNA-binding protein [Dehalobacter sp. 4CP]
MARTIRFVHCAGFQFDSRSWEGPACWTAMRNQDLWHTFEAVLTLCQKEKVDFLFVTGDLFDQENARKETVERVYRSFSGLKDTRVFITPGDQDPLVISSAYRFAEWPGNVHIFAGGVSHIEIPAKETVIYGSGWTNYRQELIDLGMIQPVLHNAPIQMMLLHAEIASPKNTDRFIPLEPEAITASGLTYLALGHQQKFSGLHQIGDTFWADCGSPEARSFQDSGPHGVLFGKTDGKLTQVDFVELGRRNYIEKFWPQAAEPKEIASGLLADTTKEERQRDLFRIVLSGPYPDPESTVQTLHQLLSEDFSYFEVYHTSQSGPALCADGNVIRRQTSGFPDLTEVFRREIQKRLSSENRSEEQRRWELVRKIGLAAISQGREDYED